MSGGRRLGILKGTCAKASRQTSRAHTLLRARVARLRLDADGLADAIGCTPKVAAAILRGNYNTAGLPERYKVAIAEWSDDEIPEHSWEHLELTVRTHIEIAREMGLSRQRVQQLEAQAFAKLRDSGVLRELMGLGPKGE